MKRSLAAGGTTSARLIVIIALATFSAAVPISLACADITPTGDVSPSNPAGWTTATMGYIGNTASGALTVDGGSHLNSRVAGIGYEFDAAGTVTIDGIGSTWTNSVRLSVGFAGNGVLNITNGGTVNNFNASDHSSDLFVGEGGNGTLNIGDGGTMVVGGTTYVGINSATGTINFASGGTLTTGSRSWHSASQLRGSGTINTCGWLADDNLVFDSLASLQQRHEVPGQNIIINLDLSNPAANGGLGAGWTGNGSVTITSGLTVTSNGGSIGYESGSTGIATVDGASSRWNAEFISVGTAGSGTLSITGGGAVITNSGARIGENEDGTGTVKGARHGFDLDHWQQQPRRRLPRNWQARHYGRRRC